MKRVVIVDDDDGFRETLSAALSLEGFEVEQATNGRECLEILAKLRRPHAVLIDLMMPIMSGWELLEVMKGDPDLSQIPAAVVSAARYPRDIPTSVTIFSKPCQLRDLLRFLGGPSD